jgi:hypothetical protein
VIPCNLSALLFPALAISVSCALKGIQKKNCTSEFFEFLWVLFGQVGELSCRPVQGIRPPARRPLELPRGGPAGRFHKRPVDGSIDIKMR